MEVVVVLYVRGVIFCWWWYFLLFSSLTGLLKNAYTNKKDYFARTTFYIKMNIN